MKTYFIFFSTLLLVTSIFAASPSTKPDEPAKQLTKQIASSDPAIRDAAVQEIRSLMENPSHIIGPLSTTYLPAMLKAGLNQDAADFAWQAILSAPADVASLESLHKCRIRALLALKKNDEALAEAKSCFNVCTMRGTGSVMLLVAECLQAAHPEDAGIAERFKAQQIAGSISSPQAGSTSSPQVGASTQPSPAATGSGSGEQSRTEANLLKAIKVDAAPYLEAAQRPQLSRDDWHPALVMRGNLLLEADEAAEARKCFEAAYKLAPEKQKREAAESLARCMKAEDGTIGRANAFVMSLRPAATTQP